MECRVLGDGASWVLAWSVLDRVGACGVPSFGMLWCLVGWAYSFTLMAIKARPLGRAAH